MAYKTRKMLTEAFRNLNIHGSDTGAFVAVLPLLERAAIEVSKLMLDSLSRFKTTEVYEKLMELGTEPDRVD